MEAAAATGGKVTDESLTFPYDASFFETVDDKVEPVIYFLMIMGVILAVAAIPYRQVASVFLFYSCLHLIVVSVIPSEHTK